MQESETATSKGSSLNCLGNSILSMNPEHIRSVVLTAAVITVSSSRTRENDTSGKAIIACLKKTAVPLSYYTIVPDQIGAIRNEIFQAMKKANCVIVNGGTGLTHDDCTIEAVAPLLEKKIDGFGEIFRYKSSVQIGTASMLSRAVAGIIYGKAIFCIPGSTPAVTLAMEELILPEIAHIIIHANK